MSANTRPRTVRDIDSGAVIATWIRRCGLPFAILAWTGVALLLLWLVGHVIQTLLLLTLAALLASINHYSHAPQRTTPTLSGKLRIPHAENPRYLIRRHPATLETPPHVCSAVPRWSVARERGGASCVPNAAGRIVIASRIRPASDRRIRVAIWSSVVRGQSQGEPS